MNEVKRAIGVGVFFVASVAYLFVGGLTKVSPHTQRQIASALSHKPEMEQLRAQQLSSSVTRRGEKTRVREPFKGLGEWGYRGRLLFQSIFDDGHPKTLTDADLSNVQRRFAISLPQDDDDYRTEEIRDRLGILRFLAICFAYGNMSDHQLQSWMQLLTALASEKEQTWAVQRRAVIALNAMPDSAMKAEKSKIQSRLPASVLELTKMTEDELLVAPNPDDEADESSPKE